MRVAGIQFISNQEPMANIDRAIEFSMPAIERGAKLLVFHQLFHAPWFLHERRPENFRLALTQDSEEIATMRDAAREHKVAMVCPIFEEAEDGNFYNTALIIDRNGMIVGRYRKTHVPNFANYFEQYYFTPGNDLPVFSIGSMRIGVAMCWENFFPEVHRSLALKGADLIVAPSAAGKRSNDRWTISIASQAITNSVYVLRVNRAGSEAGLHFYGDSFCANPLGELLYEPTGEKSAVYLVDIDQRCTHDARECFPYFQDRRPELYSDVAREQKGMPRITPALVLEKASGE